jgi:RHS repeat-associated protein
MIEGVTSSLTYNWEGKLQSGSAGGVTVALKYNPDGNRIYREVTNGATTKRKYIVDTEGALPVILLEIDSDISDPNDAIRKTYIYANDQVIAQHDGFYSADAYFYLHDRIGSVRQVIGANASVEHLYSYGPFGKRLESDSADEPPSNAWQFTGQYFDEEIEQYYLRARQLDLAVSRFTARDPYSGSFNAPLELHRYLYCINEPVNCTDPSGEFIEMLLASKLVSKMRAATAAAGATAMNYARGVVGALNMAYVELSLLVDRIFGTAASLWPSAANGPQTINNINYSVHALERMAPVAEGGRGVPPSVVENAILYGEVVAGKTADTAVFVFENVQVVMNTLTDTVITVIKTGH